MVIFTIERLILLPYNVARVFGINKKLFKFCGTHASTTMPQLTQCFYIDVFTIELQFDCSALVAPTLKEMLFANIRMNVCVFHECLVFPHTFTSTLSVNDNRNKSKGNL